MANKSGNAYALTLLCPILPGAPPGTESGIGAKSHVACLRYELQEQVRMSALQREGSAGSRESLGRLFAGSDGAASEIAGCSV